MRTLITTYIIDACISVIFDKLADNLHILDITSEDEIIVRLVDHLKDGAICEVDHYQFEKVSKYMNIEIIDVTTYPATGDVFYDICKKD
jgi:hypothetical protein